MARLPTRSRGAASRRHLRRANRSLPPSLIDDSDSDQDDLSFAFRNLSITLSSTTSNRRYYFCNLTLMFCLMCMFNMSSVQVVPTLVAMIYDMLYLVVDYVMIYFMILIWNFPNISTPGRSRCHAGSVGARQVGSATAIHLQSASLGCLEQPTLHGYSQEAGRRVSRIGYRYALDTYLRSIRFLLFFRKSDTWGYVSASWTRRIIIRGYGPAQQEGAYPSPKPQLPLHARIAPHRAATSACCPRDFRPPPDGHRRRAFNRRRRAFVPACRR
jgi:hypothetical protein